MKFLPFLGFAALDLAIHLLVVEGYGYFRDELYYLACSEHLDYGYVDHPALSILVLRAWREAFGDSLLALRFLPALSGAALVAITGLVARALGGGPYAQILAMTAALAAPEYLGTAHVYSMNVFDQLFWALAAWIVILITKTGDRRLWLLLGAVLGLGLVNKVSVLWLGAGLGAGLVATKDGRRWLTTPWPYLAALLAFAGILPYVLWNLRHDGATLAFIRNATSEKMAEVSLLDFFTGQVMMMHPLNAPLWIAGLLYLGFDDKCRRFRILAVLYLAVFAILSASGTSRAGYLAPAYTWLLAAGSIFAASRLEKPLLRILLVAILAAGGILTAPFALPVLPVESYIRYARALGVEPETEERKELAELPQHYADMHGWREIVSTVALVHSSLSPRERKQASILAPNYGVAGAIDLFGREPGLPRAMSGHNHYWLWGPRGGGEVVVLLGGTAGGWLRWFERVEQAAVIDCGYCMPYENHRPVFVGREPRVSMKELLDERKDFN